MKVRYIFVQLCALSGITIGSLAIFGYASHSPLLYSWAGGVGMALGTAVQTVIVATGQLIVATNLLRIDKTQP